MVGWNVGRSWGSDISHDTSRVKTPKWFKPIRNAFASNVMRLQGASPYAGADLGYDPATLALMPGGARDMAAGAKRGALESVTDYYARPGAPGAGSFAHSAALAGVEGDYASTVAESAREAALSDALLRRQDMQTRLNAGMDAGNLARNFATTHGRSRKVYLHRQASVGQGASGGAPAGGGGGAVP